MPLLDTFDRAAGEVSPFPLSGHTPNAGGTWTQIAGTANVSPDGFARGGGSALSISIWSGDVGSDDYEVAARGFFRTLTANATMAAVVRYGASSGLLCRLYSTDGLGSGVVNIQEAFGSYIARATLNISGLVANRNYHVVGSASGTTFSTSVLDLSTGLWLTTAGTFSSATRVAAVTATITNHSTDKGLAGLQFQGSTSDTTGASIDRIDYGPVGTLNGIATAVTLAGPTSGTAGVASSNFTVSTDSPIASGTVTVTPSDDGNGGTFTPSSVQLSSSVATAVFTYTAAAAGTYLISVSNDASLASPTPISFTATLPAATYTLTGPSSSLVGQASSAFTVQLNPGLSVGTVVITPTAGAGGGTFTPSTVSLTNTTRSATFTYTATTAGSKTIATTNDGGLTDPAPIALTAQASQTIYCDNASIIKSPTNWNMLGTAGSMSAETVWPGSYMRFRFNATAITINVSTAGLSAYPWVFYQIDAQNPVVTKLAAGQTSISITGLSAGDHELNLIYQAKDSTSQPGTWGDAQKLVVTSFVTVGGTGILSSLAARPKKAIIYGDSITAGLAVTAPPGVVTGSGTNAATASYGNHIGIALDAEFDQAGCGGDGWNDPGVGGFPRFIDAWDLIKPGVSRSLANHDYIVVLHGYNDGATDMSSSIVTNWITAARATTQAWIFLCVPFSGRQRGAITTGAANYITANPSESKLHVIDLGSGFYQAAQSGYYTTDGIHANSWQHGRLAAAYIGGIVKELMTRSPTPAATYRGGFKRL